MKLYIGRESATGKICLLNAEIQKMPIQRLELRCYVCRMTWTQAM